MEKLFQRSLIKVLSIELWKTYLAYVRETKSSLPTYKEKMAQAYDFALDKMGMDISSFGIWHDYVKFLKNVEAVGSYAENQKITAIRKVYQKGIVNPMVGIENLWKDYVAFEQSINSLIAEKLTMERSRDYMNARRVAKEYEVNTRGLNKSAPCVPPSGSAEEAKQVELWLKYCAWERSNPLKIEDQNLITKRVMFAYEQCLLCLGHHPNIWYEAAQFLEESSRIMAVKGEVDASKMLMDQTESFYERATTGVLNKCSLLHFALADFLEVQNKHEKVHGVYKKYLEIGDVDPTLCYIQYMKFCRRAEGTNQARAVFKKAREDSRTRPQCFIAAALMEYYCTKDKKIAGNVFELGFKKYKNDQQFVTEYIQFLSHLNEDNNTRVLFERTLSSGSLCPQDSVDIWNKFLEFETNVGDLPGIVKVEKRRAQALDQAEVMVGSDSARLIDRYRFRTLLPCTKEQLRAMGYDTTDVTLKKMLFPEPPAPVVAVAASAAAAAAVTTSKNGQKEDEEQRNRFRPDTSQMVPFKPKFKWFAGEHRVPGGSFPLPPAVAEICSRLPPPESFQGPFVIVERLMESFMAMPLAKEFHVPRNVNNGHSANLFNTDKYDQDLANILKHGVERTKDQDGRGKRNRASKDRDGAAKRGRNDRISDEEGEDSVSVPMNDLYRQRQQKRMK